MVLNMWFDSLTSLHSNPRKSSGTERVSAGGCISSWGAHGFLKRGLRRWSSTGSWVKNLFENYLIEISQSAPIKQRNSK